VNSSRRGRYPRALQGSLVHANNLAGALDALVVATHPRDPAFVWLLGRAEEVRLYVREVLEDYGAGRLDGDGANAIVGQYLEELHAALRTWFGEDVLLACCRVHARRALAAPREDGDTDTIDLLSEPKTRETQSASVRPPTQSEASFTLP
jgi:hypothetical protein